MTLPTPGPWMVRTDLDRVTLIRFVPAEILTDETIQAIGEALYDLVDTHGRIRLVLDLAHFDFPPSTFLGKILWLVNKARKAGGRVALCHLSRTLNELFCPLPGRSPVGLGFFNDEREAVEWAGAAD